MMHCPENCVLLLLFCQGRVKGFVETKIQILCFQPWFLWGGREGTGLIVRSSGVGTLARSLTHPNQTFFQTGHAHMTHTHGRMHCWEACTLNRSLTPNCDVTTCCYTCLDPAEYEVRGQTHWRLPSGLSDPHLSQQPITAKPRGRNAPRGAQWGLLHVSQVAAAVSLAWFASNENFLTEFRLTMSCTCIFDKNTNGWRRAVATKPFPESDKFSFKSCQILPNFWVVHVYQKLLGSQLHSWEHLLPPPKTPKGTDIILIENLNCALFVGRIFFSTKRKFIISIEKSSITRSYVWWPSWIHLNWPQRWTIIVSCSDQPVPLTKTKNRIQVLLSTESRVTAEISRLCTHC